MQVQDDDVYDEVNVVPMIDLTLVLLIIFIVMTTASVQGIKVNLPQASAAPSLAKPQTKAITITADGSIFLDAFPVTLAELEQQLLSLKAASPDFPVVIRGDAKVQYEKVIAVLDLMGRLEITQLGLVTQRIVN